MRRGVLRRKDPISDPEDVKRRRDLNRDFQRVEHEHFSSEPSMRQVRDHEHFTVVDGGTHYIYIKLGNDFYRAELTKVG